MDSNQLSKKKLLHEIINLALLEDRVEDDITTNCLIDYDRETKAWVYAKEKGIISGIEAFVATFNAVDSNIRIDILKENGSTVNAGDVVLEILGKESSILKAERTALNFLQRLSGIASLTQKFVAMLQPFNVTLLDTRKTTPGMRYLEKEAVVHGGGTNHRLNLEDMAMIKDNHIAMAGGISNAVLKIREKFPNKKIEVEVKNLTELKEAFSLKVDIIMLDNFNTSLLKEALKMVKKLPSDNRPKMEISGNVNLDNIIEKASLGVDFISVGALTHSFKSMDLSLKLISNGRGN